MNSVSKVNGKPKMNRREYNTRQSNKKVYKVSKGEMMHYS